MHCHSLRLFGIAVERRRIRKTSIHHEIQEERDRRRPIYADYPECLARYRWCVEDGLRDASRMFNVVTSRDDGAYYCRVCGGAYKRNEWEGHVLDHARQLKIVKGDRNGKSSTPIATDDVDSYSVEFPLYQDVKITVEDSLSEQTEFAFDQKLATELVAAIIDLVVEDDSVEPVLCQDCQTLGGAPNDR